MKLFSKLLLCCALLVLPALAPAEPVNRELPAEARTLLDVAYVPNGHASQKLDLYLPAKPAGLHTR